MYTTFIKAIAGKGVTLGLACAAAAFTTACSDSRSSMLPTAPSAVVDASTQNLEPGDAAVEISVTGGPKGGNGNGNGNGGGGNGNGNGRGGNGNGNGNQPTVPTSPAVPGNTTPGNTTPTAPAKTVQIEGVISVKSASTITVNAQVVTVPATAVIRHGNTQFEFSDLRVGDRVHVKAKRMTAAGSSPSVASTTLEATEVKLQNPSGNPNDPADDDEEEEEPATQLVSVAALDANASETGPDAGVFQLTRAGDTTAALTVTITLTGTATVGTDYASVPLTVTFGIGQATAPVLVVPLPDAVNEGSETVILTVVDGADYDAGSPATATVTIAG